MHLQKLSFHLSLLLGHPPKILWIRRGNCQTRDSAILLRQHHIDMLLLEENPTLGVLALF
jgi:predicted nuclease of predicted toxin-antitoxin system